MSPGCMTVSYTHLDVYKRQDKDKSIALNSLASFYAVTEKEDSALILQCKALEYAQISKDSAMIDVYKRQALA